MANNQLKNIAIIGASGHVGSQILASLLTYGASRFQLTIVTRAESAATFPPGPRLERGDYASAAFFERALAGQDAVVVTLGIGTAPDVQPRIFAAAARAGVPWVVPNEWGLDNRAPGILETLPIGCGRVEALQELERLGVSAWVGVVSNPWYDFSLPGGWWGVQAKDKTATLYDGGTAKFNTTTLPMVGKAVAGLLNLPLKAFESDQPCLEDYRNKYAFVSSFRVSQTDILASVQRATKTTPENWKIETMSAQENLDDAKEKLKQGDRLAMIRIIFGVLYKEGLGGDFESRHECLNKRLALPEEDLDEVTRTIVEKMGL